jgi:hypothetical protein
MLRNGTCHLFSIQTHRAACLKAAVFLLLLFDLRWQFREGLDAPAWTRTRAPGFGGRRSIL